MQFARLYKVSVERRMHHVAHFAWQEVGRNADNAVGADTHHGECERVIARKNCKVIAHKCAQLADAVGSARRFFETDDALRQISTQPRNRIYRNTDTSASRNVINEYRQAALLGDGAEVLVEPLLRRFVVVWRDLQILIRSEE